MSATIQTAARQYANRPQDERFPSLDAMIDDAIADKNHSGERTYNLKDLHVAPVDVEGSPAQSLELRSPNGGAQMSHWAFGQLARTLGAPASYLRDLPAPLAADCLNYGLSDSPAGTAANILIRQPNGKPPMIRACTSDSYARVWDADLYGRIAETITKRDPAWTLPPTWSGEPAGAYRGDRDSFLVIVNGGSIVNDPSLGTSGPGEMFRGLLVKNSEVGAASITIEQILFRYVCGNHMLWGAIVDQSYRRRHVGTRVLRDTIREVSDIARRWAEQSPARDEAIIRGLIDHNVAATKDAVIDELKKMGATREQAETMYATCERTETNLNPRSYWGIAQGATRASQESGYQDERYQLDRLAAQVLARGAKLVRV